MTGLAGATTAVSEAVEGVYNNAAAPAVRESYSLNWFEWEPSIGIALPGAYGGTDFNNRGEKGINRNKRTVETTDNFLYLQAGVWLQLGDLGINATADVLRYDVAAPNQTTPSLALSLTRFHLVAAYSFLNNQLCVGAGARAIYVNIDEVNTDTGAVISMLGAAPQVGVIVKPNELPWRIGATARAPVEAGSITVGHVVEQQLPSGETVRTAGGFVLPDRIRQPWELETGVAYQVGPRPLNPSWIDPHEQERELKEQIETARNERAKKYAAEIASMPRVTALDRATRETRIRQIEDEEATTRRHEDADLKASSRRLYQERKARYQNWPRERLLLLASLLMTGPSDNAVALEGFINREKELVGRTVSVSPRFSVESEPIVNLLKFRAGVYVEPSRFTDGTPRQHFTFGSDVRVLPWNVFGLIEQQTWRISAFLDVAPRYQNFGFGIGAWH